MELQTDFKFRWRVVKIFPNAQFVKKLMRTKETENLQALKKEEE